MKTAKNEYNNAGKDAVKEFFKEKKYYRKEMAKIARFSKSNQSFMKAGEVGMATQMLMDIKFYVDNVLEEIADEFEMPYILDHKIKEAKVYSKADGAKVVKQLKKSGDAKVYKVIKDKTKISGKNVMMYQLWTKNVQQTSVSNPYGVEMLRSGRKAAYLIPINEDLHPYKDFGTDNSWERNYDLNLGAFVEHYQDLIKFMKKHKPVPDKNKRAWANAIREKIGRPMLNGHMSQMRNIMDLLKMGDKFRNLKDKDGWVMGESIQERKWKGTEEELHDYLLYIKKYKPELFRNVKSNRNIKKLLKKFESVSVKEDTIKFSKEEMAQLHKDGKIEIGGHTIEFNESARKTR